MTRDEIYAKVKDVLVDALGVDDDEVTPAASLRRDLGAESIDFLDVNFRLEKAFNVKIPRGELFPESLDPKFVQDGKFTDDGLAEVRKRMPHADLTEVNEKRDPALLFDLFAVQDIVDYLERKLATP